MNIETEKSVGDISEDIARRGLPFSAFRNKAEWKQALAWLSAEFEKALRGRDERAAKIADEHARVNQDALHIAAGIPGASITQHALLEKRDTANEIASAIRGKS